MTTRIAINGFGRIGRMVFRRAMEMQDVEVVAVNGTSDSQALYHLLKYDSIHGKWDTPVEVGPDGWHINGRDVHLFETRNPHELPWEPLDIDVVIESTGQFRTRESAEVHLTQGAKKVLITAPAKGKSGADITLVRGVNDFEYDASKHHIVSGASCTTNCLGPVVKALHDVLTIESGLVTTIHSITNDQRNLDNPHKDPRRARACGQSIIPTSTGAAAAIGLVIPSLAGKLNGISMRVPTPNVSVIDLVVQVNQSTDVAEVNEILKLAALNTMPGVLGYTDEPLVSVDFNHNSHSAIVDGLSTLVMSGKTIKVIAWYDNEWGYSCRMVDLARHLMPDSKAREISRDQLQLMR